MQEGKGFRKDAEVGVRIRCAALSLSPHVQLAQGWRTEGASDAAAQVMKEYLVARGVPDSSLTYLPGNSAAIEAEERAQKSFD